jgi:hypothetical protein
MLLTVFTLFHVLVSLAGIGTGFVVLHGLLNSRRQEGLNFWFLSTTVATSVTGFLFPVEGFMPSHGVGILSVILLTIAIVARYFRFLEGGWRKTYVFTAMTAQYLNVFVLIIQLFRKVPQLEALAPTQSEPPFAVTQLVVLVAFAVLTFRAASRFQAGATRAA